MANRCVAVTGSCGFIGRYVTERLLARGDFVYAVDALTYAADPTLPQDWAFRYPKGRFKFVGRNILELGMLPDVDAVINLAAETHVDNGNQASERFIATNVVGVQHLLELARFRACLFIQISTDEVYGDVMTGETQEAAPLHPSSPYAASKAAADCLVLGWGRTYGLPWRIIRPSNCYGAYQYPEKLIPRAVRRLTLGQAMPIHGDGSAERSWLWVSDCADAIITVLDHGTDGQIYHVPGAVSATVRQVAETILAAIGRGWLEGWPDRPGQDRRYRLSDSKLHSLGWVPQGNLWRDLPVVIQVEQETIRW